MVDINTFIEAFTRYSWVLHKPSPWIRSGTDLVIMHQGRITLQDSKDRAILVESIYDK